MSAGWRCVVVLLGIAFASACSSSAGQPGTGVPTPDVPESPSATGDGPAPGDAPATRARGRHAASCARADTSASACPRAMVGRGAHGMRHAARDTTHPTHHCPAHGMGSGTDGTRNAAHPMRHGTHGPRGRAGHGMAMRHGTHGPRGHATAFAPDRGSLVDMVGPNAPVAADGSALPAGEGASDFRGACGRCHVLPDPAQHAPDAWSAVVGRMRENMERMGVSGIDEDRARRIADYLLRAAEAAR